MTLDDWRYAADEFNKIGEKIKAAGMTFGYHNHTVEFGTEERRGLLRRTAQAHRSQARGLRDGLRMGGGRRAQPGRLPEQDAGALPAAACEGHGQAAGRKVHATWSWARDPSTTSRFLRAATGLKHYFIEQEEFEGDPMTELREDVEYMRKLTCNALNASARPAAPATRAAIVVRLGT